MKTNLYPQYKESELEQLGKIPSHWQVKAIWHLYKLGRGRVINHEYIFDNPGDYPIYSSQTENNGILGYIDSYDFNGDYITWTTDGANAGTVFRRTGRFNCTNVCGTLKNKTKFKIENRYVAYALNLLTSEFVRYDINPKLMNNVMAKIRFPFPPPDEQEAIATFLDRETGRIDNLIEKKRQLIALLKEKQEALITEKVTKGLDPSVEMKDSDVDWIDVIPKHWQFKKLKYTTRPITGYAFNSDDYVDEGVSLIRISEISDKGKIDLDNAKKLPMEYLFQYRFAMVEQNDILIAMTGATIGKSGRYLSDEPSLLNQRVCKFDPQKVERPYLWFLLQSSFYSEYIKLIGFGGAQPNISDKQLLDIKCPLPPAEEQIEICEFLENEILKIDCLVEKTEEIIQVLNEYRTALINQAVTGKIDVRG